MPTWLINLWYRFTTAFWFLPAAMTAVAILLVMLTAVLDDGLPFSIDTPWWLYNGSPAGARTVLSAIASSTITVAGVLFSTTMVVISLTAQQYGPRLMRNFMEDKANEAVLGIFLATFLYCLLALRSIDEGAKGMAPHLSVTVGMFLAVASLAGLIFFIHHITASVRAGNLLARVGGELQAALEVPFPSDLGQPPPEGAAPELPPGFHSRAQMVTSNFNGYIQLIDGQGILDLAMRRDVIIHLPHRPGRFLTRGSLLAWIWPPQTDEAMSQQVNDCFVVGNERTQAQDLEYVFSQLTESALRALSPGINDPVTACNCLDWIGAGLAELLQTETPSAYRYDPDGTLRVVTDAVDVVGVMEESLAPIRHAGWDHPMVILRLTGMLLQIGPQATRQADRAALVAHALRICAEAKERWPDREELARLELVCQKIDKVLVPAGA